MALPLHQGPRHNDILAVAALIAPELRSYIGDVSPCPALIAEHPSSSRALVLPPATSASTAWDGTGAARPDKAGYR